MEHGRTDGDLDNLVAWLSDVDAVRDVILRYARAVDRCDWELAADCYHDDAIDEHGIFNGNGHDFVAFVRSFVTDWAVLSQHAAMNSLVHVAGDEAWAETYHIGFHRRSPDDGALVDVPLAGRAVDRLERRDGRWRLAHRTLVADWGRVDPVSVPFEPPAATARGRRDTSDPSYQITTEGATMDPSPTPSTREELERQLDVLLAKEEIRSVIARFARGVDRFDWELQRSCYHDDALDHHGLYDGPVDGFIEFGREWLPQWTERTTHAVMNCLIDVAGDVAQAETYVIGYHRGTPPEIGVRSDVIVAGRYVDRFERRDGGPWLIAERTFVFDWGRADPIVQEFDAVGSPVGTRDQSDRSYRRA
jgi:ketosteroid isomerase-like protein